MITLLAKEYVYRSLVGDFTVAFLLAIAIISFVGVVVAGALLGLVGLWRKAHGR